MKFLSKFKPTKSNSPEVELGIVNKQTPFAIREAFKSLYTNILYLNIESKCKKIAITSALSGEGKTSVSTNLAITFAQNSEEKRILLIDTDMRQPKVAKLLSLDRKAHGLSEYLAGIDETPNLTYLPEYKLTVLTSGGANVNPTKLMGSRRMEEFLKACENEFDYVFIDTPPINVVTDAILLNGNINGYIIATRADYSNINSVDECIETLERIGAEIYGVVLSSLKLKTGGRKYGKYSKYGKYGKYGYGRYSKYASEDGK